MILMLYVVLTQFKQVDICFFFFFLLGHGSTYLGYLNHHMITSDVSQLHLG